MIQLNRHLDEVDMKILLDYHVPLCIKRHHLKEKSQISPSIPDFSEIGKLDASIEEKIKITYKKFIVASDQTRRGYLNENIVKIILEENLNAKQVKNDGNDKGSDFKWNDSSGCKYSLELKSNHNTVNGKEKEYLTNELAFFSDRINIFACVSNNKNNLNNYYFKNQIHWVYGDNFFELITGIKDAKKYIDNLKNIASKKVLNSKKYKKIKNKNKEYIMKKIKEMLTDAF